MAEVSCLNAVVSDRYAAYWGDCVSVGAQLPDNCIDFSVYSPPFSGLYIYNDSIADMGNSKDDAEFFEKYRYLIREKLRVTKPGRLSAIHVKDLVYYSNASDRGDRGLRDFSGECIRMHKEEGWTYHSRVTIRRCPVREMTKSKPDGLLYKNFRKDCARIRQGLPEYLIVFRKWADGMDQTPPVMHDYMQWKEWAGEGERFVRGDHDVTGSFEREYYEALDIWQNWADPVWIDTSETNVLNARAAKNPEDEKHICPMPLDITERAIRLWSNAGETVLSPFMGIGSEGYVALKAQRKFIGVELKSDYWRQACRYLDGQDAASAYGDLLDKTDAA
jgi:DNA modification methylase